MIKTVVYSKLDNLSDVMTGDDKEYRADCVACLSAFTADSTDPKEMPTQRFAVALLTDRAALERGVQMTPELVRLLLDQFFEMMCGACGEELVKFAMFERVAARIAEYAEDDDDVDPTLN